MASFFRIFWQNKTASVFVDKLKLIDKIRRNKANYETIDTVYKSDIKNR